MSEARAVPMIVPVAALATATARDLARAPEFLVGFLATGALLIAVRVAALGSGTDALSVHTELTIATVGLVASLYGALNGVRATSAGSRIGPSAELVAAPVTGAQYLLGRLLGILLVLVPASGCALLFGAVLGGMAPGALMSRPAVLGLAFAGAGAQVCLTTAIGLLAGSLAPQAFATIASVLLVVIVRTGDALGSGVSLFGLRLGSLLPDPMRMEFAHELAFGRPIGLTSLTLAAAATLAYTAALLALACARRTASDRT